MQIEINLTPYQERKLRPFFKALKEAVTKHQRPMLIAQVLARDNRPSKPRKIGWLQVGFVEEKKAKNLIGIAGFDPRRQPSSANERL